MGPQSAKSYPGRRVVKPAGPKAQRAKQEIDYGRRGKGYVFGAFRPATGEAFTAPYTGRTTANWVDFLGAVEGWIDAGVERVYAVMDNLNLHSATDGRWTSYPLSRAGWLRPRHALASRDEGMELVSMKEGSGLRHRWCAVVWVKENLPLQQHTGHPKQPVGDTA